MYRLLLFLRRIYVLLIFLLLEGLALHYYANSTVHSRARLLALSDRVVGGVWGGIAGIEHYMSLGATNRLLEGRVEALENELAVYRGRMEGIALDSIRPTVELPFEYTVVRVVRNSIDKRENYIMVDRGSLDGVEKGMAVVSLDGNMVGYVESTSSNNAICVSVLNTSFRTSGMVAATGEAGSISWDGTRARTVRLSEVLKYTAVAKGDTILTSGYSFNFPRGIHIGTVENFTTDESRASYNIDVRLGVDIAALRVVVLIKNPEAFERIMLEEEVLGTDPHADGTAARGDA